jgi:MOSC domain-containing protein YiiM
LTKILSIKIYSKKGCAGESLTHATLSPEEGIIGDRHNDIALLTKSAIDFAAQNPGGACFAKFKENLIIDADFDENKQITLDNAVLEIIGGKKFCFEQCKYFAKDKPCAFKEGVAIAKVVQGGEIVVK